MALTVKQLNADASFLLTFEPVTAESTPGVIPRPFRILMDPWITGPSTIIHAMLSTTTHKESPCVCSLQHLPEPDLVIISQHKSDHCNEATLRQLPATGTRTLILAEPAAAKVIRSWKYFEKNKVHTIPRWEDPRTAGKQTVIRVEVPPSTPGGDPGEVTVAYIPQRRDFKGLHAAIGITYRPPPPATRPRSTRQASPPETPVTPHQLPASRPVDEPTHNILPTPPETPSAGSGRSLLASPSPPTLQARTGGRAASVVFSPHGVSYRCLRQYARSHLVSEAALPLTALLHCFNTVSNPWWLGGNISAGMPAGQETAAALGARAWVSAHDGAKDVRGLVTRMLRTTKYLRDEVAGVVSPSSNGSRRRRRRSGRSKRTAYPEEEENDDDGGKGTEVLILGVGEEVAVTGDGVWNVERRARVFPPRNAAPVDKALVGRERGRRLPPIVTAR